MKCNQSGPGFELVSLCPYPATITITPRAPPMYMYRDRERVGGEKEWTYICLNSIVLYSICSVGFMYYLNKLQLRVSQSTEATRRLGFVLIFKNRNAITGRIGWFTNQWTVKATKFKWGIIISGCSTKLCIFMSCCKNKFLISISLFFYAARNAVGVVNSAEFRFNLDKLRVSVCWGLKKVSEMVVDKIVV